MEPEKLKHVRGGRGRDGSEEAVRGVPSWASSQSKRVDFQAEGMINHQMSPVKEREAWARAEVLWLERNIVEYAWKMTCYRL